MDPMTNVITQCIYDTKSCRKYKYIVFSVNILILVSGGDKTNDFPAEG